MKQAYLLAAASAALALSASAAAHADVPYFYFDGSSGVFNDGSITGTFSNSNSFTSAAGTFDVTLSTSSSSGITFTTLTFDGTPLSYVTAVGGNTYYGANGVSTTGSNILDIAGTYAPPKAGATGSYSGTLSFTGTSAAPEPSTWMLMIAGVAMAGGALRYGRRNGWTASAA